MISYKHGKFIAQAIESILSQDVDFLIELVIGDDCSPDDTFEICKAYAKKDSRVKLLPREPNLGVMPNFSRTLLACSGEYVAVCEGDDYWTDSSKLAKQVQFLDCHPDYAGSTHQATVIVDDMPVRLFKENVPTTIVTDDLVGARLFHMASVLFRRPVVEIFCKAPLVLGCDRLLNFCMSFLGKIHYFPESMCAYRQHSNGMSSNATVELMKLEVNSIPYLKQLDRQFPKYRYMSYVYAAIGLCRTARLHQKIYFLTLSFIFSFSSFPRNLVLIKSRLYRPRIGKK